MNDDLGELLRVAKRAKRTLAPVAPPAEFRARLRDNLQSAAHYRATHPQAPVRAPRRELPWGWIVSAAILGSFASIVILVLRKRRAHA